MTVITKKEDIKCPACGNEDLSQFVFVEQTEARRDVIEFNDEGELLVSKDFASDTPNDAKKWLECYCLGARIEIGFHIMETGPKKNAAPALHRVDEFVKCPHCENDDIENFTVYEYSTWRNVISLKGDVLLVDGHYESEGGTNYGDEHLCCDKCDKKVGLPDGVSIDYE